MILDVLWCLSCWKKEGVFERLRMSHLPPMFSNMIFEYVCMYVYTHRSTRDLPHHLCGILCDYVSMYVCMYVCMYVYMYVAMYVCMCGIPSIPLPFQCQMQ